MNSPLQVYRASAGSGKTFRLALEYLKLALSNEYAYQYILAVSFTNKATGEMKSRILSVLYNIAKGHKEGENYLVQLEHELNKNREEIRERAQKALTRILHDYNRFNIETIDSFNQRVLRNLAKELGLSAYFNIDLDYTKALSEAVDQLIDNLDETSSSLTWISNFMEEKEKEEKSARQVEKEIKDFSSKIFDETFKLRQQEIKTFFGNRPYVEKFILQIQSFRETEKQKIVALANDFENLKKEYELEFPDRGVAGFFKKILQKETLTAVQREKLDNGTLSWFTAEIHKRNPQYKAQDIENSVLNPYLRQALEIYEQANYNINSSNLILKHIRSMALLEEIASELKVINEEKNRFLLADTTPLLHGLIGDNDTSFIYEKIGATIKHLMIDEFQDTSSMEWKNFKLLLSENISNGNSNLIVGDVKQSIYRWRNSNWETLNNIDNEFFQESLHINSLDTNYRTYRNIVDFNNNLFTLAVNLLDQYNKKDIENTEGRIKMRQAYSDVSQKSPSNKEDKGYVSVTSIAKKGNRSLDVSPHLVELIQKLKAKEISTKDITILVRTNGEISKISQVFHEHILEFPEDKDYFQLVSNEAFRLENSSAIQLLICALTYLNSPKDQLKKTQLAFLYQTEVLKKDNNILVNFFTSTEDPHPLDSYLPVEFVENEKALARIPLYDLSEKLIRYFRLGSLKNQYGYICYFLDAEQNFLKNNPADIHLFLNFWEETLGKKAISIDGDIPGIRIMTIHKSKGLEFDNVIIPFCNWSLDKSKHANLIWTEQNIEGAEIPCPLFPINYNDSGIVHSIFKNDYSKETLNLWIDNLNLLYVTLTRPKKNLFIFIEKEQKDGRLDKVSDLISQCIPDIPGGKLTYPDIENVIWNWEKGNLCTEKDTEEHTAVNACSFEFADHGNSVKYHLSKDALQFLSTWETDENFAQKRGKIFHKLLEYIATTDQTEKALQKLILEGHILEKDKAFYQKTLKELFENPYALDWFSGKYTLFQERNITYLGKNNEITSNRPDRVMIDAQGNTLIVDYKTGKQNPKYHEQINQYKQILQAMNYKNVRGFIWYLDCNKVEEV